jgi:hypothetical protein
MFDLNNGVWETVRVLPDPMHGYPSKRINYALAEMDGFPYLFGGYTLVSRDGCMEKEKTK